MNWTDEELKCYQERRATVKANSDQKCTRKLSDPSVKNALKRFCEVDNSKYHAKRVKLDGFTFDSKKEADYYQLLKQQISDGNIICFCRQVPFVLQEGYVREGKEVKPITYVADFVVWHPGNKVQVIDVKGMRTDIYKLKRKMLLSRYPDLDFREIE